MHLSTPFTTLSPGVDSAVLVALAGSTRPRTGREVARLAGRSKTAVQRVLDRLVEHGLVDRQTAGDAFLYTLNREHLLSPAVEVMAAARNELVDRLRAAIARWEIQPVHGSVFGSAARGEGDQASDVDLFIVRPEKIDAEDPTWRRQLDELASSVRRWTGNHAGISEVSAEEIPRLRRERPPVLRELAADAIDLAGRSARWILEGP
jgi:predicted transcriptional regulator